MKPGEYEAAEAFVRWLKTRLISAGRGDSQTTIDKDPAGKFWLGRLAPEDVAVQLGESDRGERLDPCACGIRMRPLGVAPWTFTASVSACVWQRNGSTWAKSAPARVAVPLSIPATAGMIAFGAVEIERALTTVAAAAGLSAEVRIEVSKLEGGPWELTLYFVNTSPDTHPAFSDTNLYECHLTLSDVVTQPFELDALPDSFRYDRRVPAYGVNCGVAADGVGHLTTIDAPSVDRGRPMFWNSPVPPPDLHFLTLARDPIASSIALHRALVDWGTTNWGAPILSARAASEGWTDQMRSEATAAATDFSEECDRVAAGIRLLRDDAVLRRSFQLMNSAMARAVPHREWRAFQLGFLLSNLPSIVDTVTQPETVDIVWFATGGGKTETYLGQILTNAFHDRLTGKHTGITAWSRFPLRMLSLQQTQRFANALAAGETVRLEEDIPGDEFSLGFFVGATSTPNSVKLDPKEYEFDCEDDEQVQGARVLLECPFCRSQSLSMAFDRRVWRLNHRCGNPNCSHCDRPLPFFIVDDEIYRFLPTVIVGTLDKAALISMQASMRGFVGPPWGRCSDSAHGFVYAPRSGRASGCLVPGCTAAKTAVGMDPSRFAPSLRLQDELHLLKDSLGAVDAHYEALFDDLQRELTGRRPKILASSATLEGYERQVAALYLRKSRVFPVAAPSVKEGFWARESAQLMRHFVALAPRGVTIEYTVDRLLTELQTAVRLLATDPVRTCADIGIDPAHADLLILLYGTNVVYGNTIRDLDAVSRSLETQVQVQGSVNTAQLTGSTDFSDVRQILERLKTPEGMFDDRLHVITASSMMSHGVDIDRLNTMVMVGLPLATAEFIQASARIGRTWPGLVVVVHKIGRERDAGIYRSFPTFVTQGDRFVEPVPVTRRSRRVLENTIAGIELARILMLSEPASGSALTTAGRLRTYFQQSGSTGVSEGSHIAALLGFEGEYDQLLCDDVADWAIQFYRNVEEPASSSKLLKDVSPTGRPMTSLRDVEEQVPIFGRRD
jgi:helicase-like protein